MSAPNSCLTDGQLEALRSGAMPEPEMRDCEAHLSDCSRCRTRIDGIDGVERPWSWPEPQARTAAESKALREAMTNLKADPGIPSPLPEESLPSARATLRYLGDYEILEELGRGGMGVVYRARQMRLQREVALKVILAGAFASESVVRRFQVEAEAAAKLEHPHIVPIIEIGVHDGHHFYSMRLIEGGSLAERCSEVRLASPASDETVPPAEHATRATRLASLSATIARAVHYAHQRGVLHRDLKPDNILLDRNGQPHVADFGLAKLLEDDSSLTHSAAIMGSANYIAPEVAAGHARDATTAADVYSLGAILYELLAGCPPFQTDSPAQTLRLVLDTEPESPAARNPSVPADLATICLKCLEKDPARRYSSAALLADELERFCRGEPILARPITRTERFQRWCLRQPALAGSLTALILVFIAGFAGIVWKWRGEVHQRRVAQEAVIRLDRTITQLEIERAESQMREGDSSRGLAFLARLLRQHPTNFVVAERMMSALSERSFCLPIAPLRHGPSLDTLTGERKQQLAPQFAFRKPGSVVTVNFSPDGSCAVTTSRDGTARIWKSVDGEPLGEPLRHAAEVLWAEFSGNGQKVVTASVDGTAKIWAAETGRPIAPPLRHDDIVFHAAFSSDSQKVITASQDKSVRVWDSQTGQPLGQPLLNRAPVYFASFNANGSRILTGERGQDVNFARLWDASAGTLLTKAEHFHFAGEPAPFPIFHPSLDQAVTLLWHAATLHNWNSNLSHYVHLLHDGFCTGATYSRDGRRLATVSSDTKVRLWNAQTCETTLAPLSHDGPVSMADFSADGQQLLTASHDKSARLWNVRTGEMLAEPLRQEHAVFSAKISADGHRLATVSETDQAWLWDVRRLQPLAVLRRLPIVPRYARFSPDGRQLVVVDESDHARVWNAHSGAFQSQSVSHAPNAIIQDAQFSPDGRRLLTSCENRTVQVWDPTTGQPLAETWVQPRTAHRIRFSPQGRHLATVSNDGVARLLDAQSGQVLLEMRHSNPVYSAEFSQDGTMLVTASADATARIWNTTTGQQQGPALTHDAEVYHAEFDRAAQRVATASKDKTVRIWSVQTGQLLVPPLVHADSLLRTESVAFSPDDSQLATAAGNTVQVWDAVTGRAVTTPIRHGGLIRSLRFSPDGRKLLTAAEDGTARLWDPKTGHPVSEVMGHGGGVTSAEFSPDGTRIVTCSADMAVRAWEVTSAPLPVPDWLPALAEAVAAQRIDANNVGTVVPVEELYRLRQKLAANSGQGTYDRWARWFFADSASRTISLRSEITLTEYVQLRIQDKTRESLQEAALLSATNLITFLRLAENLSTPQRFGPHKAPAIPEDAEWFSRYATNLAPTDPEALCVRDLVLQRLPSNGPAPTQKK